MQINKIGYHYMNYNSVIEFATLTREPRIGSWVLIRGTFVIWFIQIHVKFAEINVPPRWKWEPVKTLNVFHFFSIEFKFGVKKRGNFMLSLQNLFIASWKWKLEQLCEIMKITGERRTEEDEWIFFCKSQYN
jgi:hypothetical protein